MQKLDLSGKKAFIFDLDGTLIDTEKLYRVFWPKAVESLGYHMKDEQYLALRSLGRPFVYDKMSEWFGEDFPYDEARKNRTVYMEEYFAKHGIERLPGALEFINKLKEEGYLVAIATATSKDRTYRYLEMAGIPSEKFDKIISAADVPMGKPAPDVYLHACEELGLKPNECVSIEDSPNGIISAKKAGLYVIYVPNQSPVTKEDEDYFDVTVNSLLDLL